MRKLLLLSNSTNHGEGYLDHALAEMLDLLGAARRILFVPFALADRAGYTAKFRARLALAGVEVDELAADETGAAADRERGGGLRRRRQHLPAAARRCTTAASRRRCGRGPSPACRTSAPRRGSMSPVRRSAPPTTCRSSSRATFDALGLVPFQINPHYLDADPSSTHMGETREQRLAEFLEENDRVVVGLREGGWIRVEGGHGHLGGARAARVFRRGAPRRGKAVRRGDRRPAGRLDPPFVDSSAGCSSLVRRPVRVSGPTECVERTKPRDLHRAPAVRDPAIGWTETLLETLERGIYAGFYWCRSLDCDGREAHGGFAVLFVPRTP